jgi:hypothetical protein
MFPASINKDSAYSERIVFEAISSAPGRDDWIAISSLHQYKVVQNKETETDFVVLIPGKGLVVIEVKGATEVTLEGEKWTLVGVPPGTEHKSPLKQVEHSIRNIKAVLRSNDVDIDSLPIARLLWFSRIEPYKFAELGNRGMEIRESELAFNPDLADPIAAIEKCIDTFLFAESEKSDYGLKPEEFTADKVQDIKNILIVSATGKVSIQSETEIRLNEIFKATEQQMKIFEAVRHNENLYIHGPTGTGKSLMLGQAAVDLAKTGRQVLITCYNIMLADDYQLKYGSHPNITVMPIYELFLQTTAHKQHKTGDNWFDYELPVAAKNAIRVNSWKAAFDVICIDEFQDITTKTDVINAIFEYFSPDSEFDPRVIIAGDDALQIYRKADYASGYPIVKEMYKDVVRVELEYLCRQAPGLSKKIAEFTKYDREIKSNVAKDVEWGFEVIRCTADNELEKLEGVLRKLLENYYPVDIRILSPFGEDHSLLANLAREETVDKKRLWLKQQLRNMSDEGKIRWRSLFKFKGLEQDVIVVTDLNSNSVATLAKIGISIEEAIYAAASTARFKVILLINDELLTAGPNPKLR